MQVVWQVYSECSLLRQVLFLDADNIAVRDPLPLFASPGYNATGALLWPDYWERSAAPDIADVLGLDPGQLPTGTFESGQMALDKRRWVRRAQQYRPSWEPSADFTG